MISSRLLFIALAAAAILAAQPSAADAFSAASGPKARPGAPSTGVPDGTAIVVKLIDDIDSERDPVGRAFPAMVDDPLVFNGQTLLPRGVDATVRLVQDPKAPRVLTLELVEIVWNGRGYPVKSDSVALTTTPRAAEPHPQQAAAPKQGGASTLGAILGALSGTEQGAEYLGTVTGSASAGVARTWVTGARVRLNEETRLTFKISNAVRF
jgi:hypothetical protein